MLRYTSTKSIRDYILTQKKSNKSVGFIPTMGALHAGHLELVKKSTHENDITVVSIFVNPTQFNNAKDLEKYPRVIDEDIFLLTKAKCDVLFSPSIEEMYPNVEQTWNYEIGELATILEGKYRKGHFEGVTQIVYKLFNAVPADKAYFGKKDYQQLLIIKKLVNDFKIKVEIVGCEIVRETDGLAYSSRNMHLNKEERIKALALSKSLYFIRDNWHINNKLDVYKKAISILQSADVKIEYLEIRNADTLDKINNESKAVALVAAFVGNTRLIDNMMLG